jgi:acetyl-CoA acetyltransferase
VSRAGERQSGRPEAGRHRRGQFYVCFTITVLMQLEAYGFRKPGEGGSFVDSGAIDMTGSPSTRPGGNLSEGHIHGMNHVLEGVRQVRGTSTSQVSRAEVCVVTSAPLASCRAELATALT